MPVVNARDPIEAYRARALAGDISELSGRGHRRFFTEFVADQVLSAIAVQGSDRLLDVGCGDGTLLLEAANRGVSSTCIGILPTAEEVERVRDRIAAEVPGPGTQIEIQQGLAEDLPIKDGAVDILICNGVLHMAGRTEAATNRALAEFARAVTPGGVIYIGELSERDEFEGEDYGTTARSYLRGVYRHQGASKLFKTMLKMLRATFGAEPFVYGPYGCYFCSPDRFTGMLADHGIVVERSFRHLVINRKGRVSDSPSRWNYLCRKV